VYIYTVLIAGLVFLVAAWSPQPLTTSDWGTFLVLTALVVPTQFFDAVNGRQSYFLHTVFFFAGALLLPPQLFLLVVLIPHMAEWIQKRLTNSPLLRAWYIQPFNVATHLIAGLGSYWLYTSVGGSFAAFSFQAAVLAPTVAVFAYVFVNHILIGQALVLARGMTWKESGTLEIESLVTDIVMMFVGYAMAALWNLSPWLIVPAVAPLVLLYRALTVPELQREAQTDEKTGLWNARHFDRLFTNELERSENQQRPLTLIMADLDLLRNINNTYGHLAGDTVLAGIAKVIRDNIRDSDFAGRFGGEEFAIVLPGAGELEARATAERLRRAVEGARFQVSSSPTPIKATMSLGLSCYPQHASTTKDLIHEADVALYQAKLSGRNMVRSAADVPHAVKLEFDTPGGSSAKDVGVEVATQYAAAFKSRANQPAAAPDPASTGAESSSGPDVGTETGTDTGTDTGVDAGVDAGADAGTEISNGRVNSEVADHQSHRMVGLPDLVPALPPGGEQADQATGKDKGQGKGQDKGQAASKLERRRPIQASDWMAPLDFAAVESGLSAKSPDKKVLGIPGGKEIISRLLQIFVGVVVFAALAITVWRSIPLPALDLTALALLAALAASAELLQVRVYGENTVSVSMSIAFATAIILGIPGLVLVSAVIVAVHYFRAKPPLYRTAFNWATHVLAGTMPVLMIYDLQLSFDVGNLPLLVTLAILATMLYYLIETGLVATAMSMSSTRSSLLDIWREQFRWLGKNYLVLGLLGLFLAFAYAEMGPLGLLVFALPVFMMHQTQKEYVRGTENSMAELRRMNQELAVANQEVTNASLAIQRLNDQLFLVLAKIIDARDPYVSGHATQVADYAVAIAKEIGIPNERLEEVRQAGLLHDIGKIGISDSILNKPARLTESEYENMKSHVTLGADFLETCNGLQGLAPFIRHHHEWWDGSGYPSGLQGTNIPMVARILAVCDAVEAMASDRPYQPAMPVSGIVPELKRCAGTQFDPKIVEAFTNIIERRGPSFIVNTAVMVNDTRNVTFLPGSITPSDAGPKPDTDAGPKPDTTVPLERQTP
jgi:diguanylate cyclase (GGDEF)-like protein/putative nucleotidyltransferase with HDIG domain